VASPSIEVVDDSDLIAPSARRSNNTMLVHVC